MHDLKMRELDIREREAAAREKLMQAQTVNTGVTSTFAAMQAAEKIAMNPLIAPAGSGLGHRALACDSLILEAPHRLPGQSAGSLQSSRQPWGASRATRHL
jgi:hypothetical protein